MSLVEPLYCNTLAKTMLKEISNQVRFPSIPQRVEPSTLNKDTSLIWAPLWVPTI